jgi:outer membrane protein TolC
MRRTSYTAMLIGGCCLTSVCAKAQISFTSAIDLALRNSPRVRMAEADVERARASLAEAQDVYIPVVMAASGLGYSYGYPLGTPTIATVQASSLLFNYSQRDYIRSARFGLAASNLSLKDVRQEVAEDTSVTYLALDRGQERLAALKQEASYAARLAAIVRERLDAGQDTEMELTRAKRTVAQLRLLQLQMEDEIATQSSHLSLLLGIAGTQIETVPGSIPTISETSSNPATSATIPDGPAVLAAAAKARAKQEQAFGDNRYVLRPQIAFAAQYSRFSTFNNYQLYYPAINNNFNAIGIGVQIQLPLFDASRKAKGRESTADFIHSEGELKLARQQQEEGRMKVEHSVAELQARAELADLDNDLAQQQLEAMLVELQAGTGNSSAPQMTPKDEQNARILERQRYLDVLDSRFQLRQTQINLLRQTGQLEAWLKSVAAQDTILPAKP